MTREEAKKTLPKSFDGIFTTVQSANIQIDKIYDDFESHTCENCKWWLKYELRRNEPTGYGNCDEINHTNTETEFNFGCNRWEQK